MEQEESVVNLLHWTAEGDENSKKQYDCNKLLDAEQFDLEDQVGIWRNTRPALRSIGKITRNKQLAFATHFHSRQPFVPTLNDLAELELDRFSRGLVGVVEFSAVFQAANVVDRHRLPHLRAWSITDPEILNF